MVCASSADGMMQMLGAEMMRTPMIFGQIQTQYILESEIQKKLNTWPKTHKVIVHFVDRPVQSHGLPRALLSPWGFPHVGPAESKGVPRQIVHLHS